MKNHFEENKDKVVNNIIQELQGFHSEEKIEILNAIILKNKEEGNFKENNISDGYHTFNELYEFRKMYNAALFNEWALDWMMYNNGRLGSNIPITTGKYNVHKSWKHNDGELCFGGGWFIVSAMLPTGLISNHYKAKDWDLFKIPEVEKALYEFDGHTGKDVLLRLEAL